MSKINKSSLSVTILAFSISSITLASSPTQAELREQNKAYLKKMGIELLDGEIRIVDAKTVLRNSKNEYYSSKINQYLSMKLDGSLMKANILIAILKTLFCSLVG